MPNGWCSTPSPIKTDVLPSDALVYCGELQINYHKRRCLRTFVLTVSAPWSAHSPDSPMPSSGPSPGLCSGGVPFGKSSSDHSPYTFHSSFQLYSSTGWSWEETGGPEERQIEVGGSFEFQGHCNLHGLHSFPLIQATFHHLSAHT